MGGRRERERIREERRQGETNIGKRGDNERELYGRGLENGR